MKIELEDSAIEELQKILREAVVSHKGFLDTLGDDGQDEDHKTIEFYESFDVEKTLMSLIKIVDFALNENTKGSEVCVNFLVNIYNSYRAKFDISEMCNLDMNFYYAFLDIIHLNRLMFKEIHFYIKDGIEIFEELAAKVK